MPLRLSRVAWAGGFAVLWVVGLVWFRPWIAHNDFAIFRIALERELDGHVRLVGAHSRLGVFHPGPLREWVFALPYWSSGRRAASLPATALVINVGWAIWTLALARRLRPPLWGASCALGLLVVVVALGADLASPWNPHLAILPMYLGCWAVVTVIANHGEGWVACVCATSFAAQLHASVLLVAGGLLVAGLVTVTVRRSHVVASFGLTVALWAGPIVDLRRGPDANLIRLATVGADGRSVGFGDALGHVSRLLWPPTPLSRVSVRPSVVEFSGFHRWWLGLAILGLVGAALWARRRKLDDAHLDDAHLDDAHLDDAHLDDAHLDGAAGHDQLLVAASVAMGVLAAGVLTVTLFVEPAYRYLYGPLQAAFVFVAAVVLTAAIDLAQHRLRPLPGLRWVGLAAVPVGLVAVIVTVPRHDGPSDERRALGVESAVSAALDARPEWRSIEAIPLDLRGAGDLDAEVLDVALRQGVDARSRRVELGLPAPVAVDGVFGVAMSPRRDCLVAEAAEEIVRGTTASGETFSVFVVERGSVADVRCIGAPAG